MIVPVNPLFVESWMRYAVPAGFPPSIQETVMEVM